MFSKYTGLQLYGFAILIATLAFVVGKFYIKVGLALTLCDLVFMYLVWNAFLDGKLKK
jgi:predicted Zn-dependent protease